MAQSGRPMVLMDPSKLPLEKRYVWRVASALKWTFAGFDDPGVEADCRTLTLEDSTKVMKTSKIPFNAVQHFLSGLVGMEMLRVMVQAMKTAKYNSNRFRDCSPGVRQFAYERHERNKSYRWI